MLPLQGLHAGQLIVTDDPLPAISQLLSLVIQAIDVRALLLKVSVPLGG